MENKLRFQQSPLNLCTVCSAVTYRQVCPESIHPCTIKHRDIYWRRCKIQEMLYTGQWWLSSLQSRHLGTSHSSLSLHQLPHCIFLNPSSLSKVIVVLGKTRSCRVPNLGCSGTKSPGWSDVSQKNTAQDVMHEPACCHDEAANHQLPVAVAFWIIWLVSSEECSNLMQNLVQIHCSTHSVILNVTATQYTCSLNGFYCLHCSCRHILVHSPWLPGYIGVAQTILVVLTMVGPFLDRPHFVFLKILTLQNCATTTQSLWIKWG